MGLGDVCRWKQGVWEKDGAMLWLSKFLPPPSCLTLIMFGGGLNRKMLPCLIMCLDNMCVSLFFGVVVVIFMLDRFSTKMGVFGLILIQRRRESYIPPRITHTYSTLGLSISSMNPLRYSSAKNLKEPHSK